MKAFLVILSDIAKWPLWLGLAKVAGFVLICAVVGVITVVIIETINPTEDMSLSEIEFNVNNFAAAALLGLIAICAVCVIGTVGVAVVLAILTAIAYLLFEFKYDVKDYIKSVKTRSMK